MSRFRRVLAILVLAVNLALAGPVLSNGCAAGCHVEDSRSGVIQIADGDEDCPDVGSEPTPDPV